ncbi:hypothetical protein [Cellulomonas sp. URHD0024]|uniref:hypothetical protein n=1 Tax=Cellulomonas sp. URHD0024 TaxID=1302620 RepID=UPI0003F5663C|nr:hypothetical protein [Cellulomonas sp. URHD0024]
MAAKKSTWIGGTAFVGVVIAAGAYVFAISPTMSKTSELRDQTTQTVSANQIQEVAVRKLAADFAKLDEYKAQLAAIHQKVPTTEQLAEYLLALDAIAVAHSVTITAITPGLPTLLAPPPAPAPTPTPTDGTSKDAPAADAATPAAPGPVTSPLISIPFSVGVVGSFDNTNAFLFDVQNSPRLLLVSSVTATAKKEGAGGAGYPATHDGDQELVIVGQAYVLPDGVGTPTPDPTAKPAPLPGAVPGKNPMIPVG